MKRQEVLNTLAAHRVKLQEMGVGSLSLFGSVARDEAVDTSDVDLVTRAALRDEMRDEILQEAIHAT